MYGPDASGIADYRFRSSRSWGALENVMQAKLFDAGMIRLDQLYPRSLVSSAKTLSKELPKELRPGAIVHH